MYIAGLDIGSTGCKVTVFDETGAQLHKSYRDYPVTRKIGAHEVDPDAITEGVFQVLTETAEKYPNLEAIGVTSFGETFALVDENGKCLRTAMIYSDPRGGKQVEELCEKLGEKRYTEIVGIKPHQMYSLPKLLWVKENEPELFAKTKHIFLMEDYVVYRLTGETYIDYSLATRTIAFDIRQLDWSEEVLTVAGIDKGLFSKPVPSGTMAGFVMPEVAAKTGLSPNTKVVCVSHDQVAAAVGAGVFDSDSAVDGAGTVECITPIYDGIPDVEIMSKGYYAVVPYVIPGKYVCYVFSYTGGALTKWCVDTMARKEREEAKEQGVSVYEYLEKRSESPTGLLVLPHFSGAATPYMDNDAKGVIVGLTSSSTVADIYRGCLEGVVYEMILNLEWLKPSGIHFKRLAATGGGAHSKEWMQMKADMLNMPITALETVDAGTVGSAMLTGIAVGLFKDLEEATRVMVHPMETYYPREEMHRKYMNVYERYSKLYDAVRPLM